MPEVGDTLLVADLLQDKSLNTQGSLTSQVFTLLKDLIITLQLHPGQMLSDKEVAEALQASKTPVRDPMIRLQSAGLVTIVPKTGTFITPIQIERYIEACFTRVWSMFNTQ